ARPRSRKSAVPGGATADPRSPTTGAFHDREQFGANSTANCSRSWSALARCRRLDHRVRARVDEPGLAVVALDQIGRRPPGTVHLDDLADLVRMPDAVAVNANAIANGGLHVRTSSARAVPAGWQLPAKGLRPAMHRPSLTWRRRPGLSRRAGRS